MTARQRLFDLVKSIQEGERLVHPLDPTLLKSLLKIDDWSPSGFDPDLVPHKEGAIHPTKGFESVRYSRVSKLGDKSPYAHMNVWLDRPADRERRDKYMNQLKDLSVTTQEGDKTEEIKGAGNLLQGTPHRIDKKLFSSFWNHIAAHPARHVRKTFPSESEPRARHAISILEKNHEGNEVHFINAQNGGRLMVVQCVRHGEGDVPPNHFKAERWIWNGKSLQKHPSIPSVTFHMDAKPPRLDEFFGPIEEPEKVKKDIAT